MNDSKFLKLLYVIICLMLCAFFGFGIYFIQRDIYGAGLIAIGIGLIGLGISLFLGTGLLFAVDDTINVTSQLNGGAVLSGRAVMKDVTYTFPAVCRCKWLDNVSVDVSVSNVGFFVNNLIYLEFSNISKVAHDDTKFVFVGELEYNNKFYKETIGFIVDNKMKCKMFEKALSNANVQFVDSDVAQSVMFDIFTE